MPDDGNNRELDDERWRGHRHEHKLEAVALKLAVSEINRRLTEMNEFRKENLADRAKYVTRPELITSVSVMIALFMLLIAYFKH